MPALAIVAASGSVPAIAKEASADHSLQALRDLDTKVATVALRLALASDELCSNQVHLPGIVPHDLSQYHKDSRAAASALFGLGDYPGVLTVAKGGPAYRAGLREDDTLISIDGRPFPAGRPTQAAASFNVTEQVLDLIEAAFSDGQAELVVRRGGRDERIAVKAEHGCASRFQVIPSRSFGASADGQYVQITSRMVAFAENEPELAAILAHELAHNILQHRARLNDAGIKRGLLRYFGRNARLIRATEEEADLLSVYILNEAGYSPFAAAQMWERLGPRRPWGIMGSPTHPNWKKRVAALRAEAAKLARPTTTACLPALPGSSSTLKSIQASAC